MQDKVNRFARCEAAWREPWGFTVSPGVLHQGDIIYFPNKAKERKSGFKAALDILAFALILPFTGVERKRDKAIFRRIFRFSGAGGVQDFL